MRNYLVVGHPRSGTSMMMQAIEASGIPVLRSTERDKGFQRYEDKYYRLNPKGLYELTTRQQIRHLRTPETWEGSCIKALLQTIPFIASGNWHVVLMTRDFEEIRQSFIAALSGTPSIKSEDEYRHEIAYVQGILNQRIDVTLTTLHYREDVLADPHAALSSLGWPIDVDAAAAVVDSQLCRFKRENLTVGI